MASVASVVEEAVTRVCGDDPETIEVRSRRFGDFAVPVDRVLHFPQGLIGFPRVRRFVILDHRPGSPFKWMLCLEQPDVAFAVVEPADFVPGYRAPIDLPARTLGPDPGDVV